MAAWKVISATLMCVLCTAQAWFSQDKNIDIYLETPELIKRNGYPVEVHTALTKDGYILNMHRIPHGINGYDVSKNSRPVVFLQHGLACSSSDWVIMGPEQGFAYMLADAGYDVWMGNVRGNRYSRNHVSLHPRDRKFWDFSWHEMAYYDIPAQVDYVISKTGQKQMYYAGHSMGTTMFYVMNTLRPEYNVKFKAMFSLAPIAFMGKVRSPIRFITPFITKIRWLMSMLGIGEFLPSSAFIKFLASSACKSTSFTQPICKNVLFLMCGYSEQQLNETALPAILSHAPAGTSAKAIIHYGQEIMSKKFCQYDYGIIGNLKRYGSVKPPEYDLSRVTTPIYLHYSDNDWLAHQDDVQLLYRRLPNVVGQLRVPLSTFNHLDFVYGIDAKKLLYDKVMAIMKRHLANIPFPLN